MPDYKVTLRLFAIFAAIVVVLAYLGSRFSDSGESAPCNAGGMPARCYHVNKDMCELIWKKSIETCAESVKALNLPPGRLVGPYVTKCELAHFDKGFIYARKSNAECDPMFADLEDWRKRNDK